MAQGKAPRGLPSRPRRQPPGTSGPAADRHIAAAPPPSAVRPNQRRGLAPCLAPPPHPHRGYIGLGRTTVSPSQLWLGPQPYSTLVTEATDLSGTCSHLRTSPRRLLCSSHPSAAAGVGPACFLLASLCVSAAGWRDAAGPEASHAGAAAAVRRGSQRRGKRRGAALPAGRAPRRLRPRGAAGRPGEAAVTGAGRAGPSQRGCRGLCPRGTKGAAGRGLVGAA